MLIGELSRRTGVSTRLLRYYEEQELLLPGRDAHGYRCYSEDAPMRVEQIRRLLEAGVSTREIKHLIPCATEEGLLHCDHSHAVMRGGWQDEVWHITLKIIPECWVRVVLHQSHTLWLSSGCQLVQSLCQFAPPA